MNLRIALILFHSFMSTGCSTIYFDNGPVTTGVEQEPEWHHNFAWMVYEGSDPVSLNRRCNGRGWKSVKTEYSFENAVIGGAANLTASLLVFQNALAVGPDPIWWYPKTVEVTCKE